MRVLIATIDDEFEITDRQWGGAIPRVGDFIEYFDTDGSLVEAKVTQVVWSLADERTPIWIGVGRPERSPE